MTTIKSILIRVSDELHEQLMDKSKSKRISMQKMLLNLLAEYANDTIIEQEEYNKLSIRMDELENWTNLTFERLEKAVSDIKKEKE